MKQAWRPTTTGTVLAGSVLALMLGASGLSARQQRMPTTVQTTQKLDEEYTKRIREHSSEKRAMTELVDHMPASDTVPSPLKFLGRVVGQPGELTYAKDIHRYYEQLAKVSPRA